MGEPLTTDVLVVGAGPAGSAAAAWAARLGLEVLLVDAAEFPRDKPCGDGLTPRAMAELEALGMAPFLKGRPVNWGLRAAGFGHTLLLPWPGGSLPAYGCAVPRFELDAAIREVAREAGAATLDGLRAVGVGRDGARVSSIHFRRGSDEVAVRCRQLVVADGAKSQLGRILGRRWHRDTVYGVAARGYLSSARSEDPWISSHLELRGADSELLSGYGWVFPLGRGEINIGVGTLATERRPAEINLRSLMSSYAEAQREDWQLEGSLRAPWSALLPMGGAVSSVAGTNWLLVGDAAGCVNPLNGEGIDYGLETGRLAAELLAAHAAPGPSSEAGFLLAWPATLRRHYGAAFSIARRLAGLITSPGLLPTAGPLAMSSRTLMTLALRVMGNLILEEDRDTLARVWRAAGRLSMRLDERPPFPAADLRPM